MSYKIKKGVIFRKELGNLIILSPKTKKLFVFKKNFADLVSDEGVIKSQEANENVLKIISLLKREEII